MTANAKRILVVDDDESIRDLVAQWLEPMGLSVARVGGVAQALEADAREPADLVITDVVMPGRNGFDLLQRFRDQGRRVPVVMMTGLGTEATRDRARRFGTLAFIDKPFTSDTLRSAVRLGLEEGPRMRRGRAILVVDDDPQIRELLRSVLEGAGYDVASAENAEQAMRLAREKRPRFDLAMIDIVLPGGSGDRVVDCLREECPETLPVLMTGEAQETEIREAYAAGGHTLLRKPFELGALLYCLSQMEAECDARRQEAERRRALAARPAPVRAAIQVAETIRSEDPKTRSRVRFVWLLLTVVTIAVGAFFGAVWIEEQFTGKRSRILDFMDRIEGYLIRDEQRELERRP